jgi:hypothetical protein
MKVNSFGHTPLELILVTHRQVYLLQFIVLCSQFFFGHPQFIKSILQFLRAFLHKVL